MFHFSHQLFHFLLIFNPETNGALFDEDAREFAAEQKREFGIYMHGVEQEGKDRDPAIEARMGMFVQIHFTHWPSS